jgi:hypothetical protein
VAALQRAAGSTGEINFGATFVAAPNAASFSTARYSVQKNGRILRFFAHRIRNGAEVGPQTADQAAACPTGAPDQAIFNLVLARLPRLAI